MLLCQTMEEIKYREYVRHVGRWMKEGVYEVVGRSQTFRVTVQDVSHGDDVRTDFGKTMDEAHKRTVDKLFNTVCSEKVKEVISEYGCGCKKEDKAVLCKKHGRY